MSEDKIQDGGPAFPLADSNAEYESTSREHCNGMTLRQYAAIKLKVPGSGTGWLDDMIRDSQRDDLAGRAMQALIEKNSLFVSDDGGNAELVSMRVGVSVSSYVYADAMLKAREVGNE